MTAPTRRRHRTISVRLSPDTKSNNAARLYPAVREPDDEARAPRMHPAPPGVEGFWLDEDDSGGWNPFDGEGMTR